MPPPPSATQAVDTKPDTAAEHSTSDDDGDSGDDHDGGDVAARRKQLMIGQTGDWEHHKSPVDGRTYYFNPTTQGESVMYSVRS